MEVMMEQSLVFGKAHCLAGLMEGKLDPYSCLVPNLEDQKDSSKVKVKNSGFWMAFLLVSYLEPQLGQATVLMRDFLTVLWLVDWMAWQ